MDALGPTGVRAGLMHALGGGDAAESEAAF